MMFGWVGGFHENTMVSWTPSGCDDEIVIKSDSGDDDDDDDDDDGADK